MKTASSKLLDAAEAGDSASLEKLLLAKNNPNDFASGEDGPLHIAARKGHTEAVRLLLSHKAKVNTKGVNGYTPLMRAADAGSFAIVKMLLEAGADVSLKNAAKTDALHCVLCNSSANADIARLLIEHGADCKDYETPYGPMFFAASFGTKAVVEVLIEKGARISTKNREGETPMDGAIQHKNHEVIKLLLAQGADPDSKDRSGFGKTLLQYAADSGDGELVSEVRRRQIDKRATDGGQSAQNDIATGAIVAAARKGDLAVVKILVDSGLEINDRDTDRNETALMAAAGKGRDDIVAYLIDYGADLAAKDERGNTPLDYAAAENQLGAISILLSHGADVHSKNNLNWNALMQAAFKGQLAAAEILLKAGSSVNEVDLEHGASVLWLARQSGNKQLVELLESHGAKERTIRQRKPEEPYFLITECDICNYLPDDAELTHSYEPEEIVGLDVIHRDCSVDYKAEDTKMLKRCIHCGTYYSHTHYIDTEDSVGGAAPICNHHLSRLTLLEVQSRLRNLGQNENLAEVEARFPAVVKAFLQQIAQGYDYKPTLQSYVIKTLAAHFIQNEDWLSLRTTLLEHKSALFVLEAIHYLLLLHGLELNESDRETTSFLRRHKLVRLFKEHKTELNSYLDKFKDSRDTAIQKRLVAVQWAAKKSKLIS